MHDLGRPHDLAAVELPDALVAEAHAEHGHAAFAERADGLVRDAGVLGTARARATTSTASGVERVELRERERVVAMHDRLGAELAQVLDEVVDERVVVVDHEHTGRPARVTVTRHLRATAGIGPGTLPARAPVEEQALASHTPPPAKKAPPSKLWVPATMFTMLVTRGAGDRRQLPPAAPGR